MQRFSKIRTLSPWKVFTTYFFSPVIEIYGMTSLSNTAAPSFKSFWKLLDVNLRIEIFLVFDLLYFKNWEVFEHPVEYSSPFLHSIQFFQGNGCHCSLRNLWWVINEISCCATPHSLNFIQKFLRFYAHKSIFFRRVGD